MEDCDGPGCVWLLRDWVGKLCYDASTIYDKNTIDETTLEGVGDRASYSLFSSSWGDDSLSSGLGTRRPKGLINHSAGRQAGRQQAINQAFGFYRLSFPFPFLFIRSSSLD